MPLFLTVIVVLVDATRLKFWSDGFVSSGL